VKTRHKQSDDSGALRQPNEHSKACLACRHAQRGILRDSEDYDVSHLSAFGGIKAF
jgi:hypothetical protein